MDDSNKNNSNNNYTGFKPKKKIEKGTRGKLELKQDMD
jgi:hypothetical protein